MHVHTLAAMTIPKSGAAKAAILRGVASAPARQPTCLIRLLPKKMTTKVVIPSVLPPFVLPHEGREYRWTSGIEPGLDIFRSADWLYFTGHCLVSTRVQRRGRSRQTAWNSESGASAVPYGVHMTYSCTNKITYTHGNHCRLVTQVIQLTFSLRPLHHILISFPPHFPCLFTYIIFHFVILLNPSPSTWTSECARSLKKPTPRPRCTYARDTFGISPHLRLDPHYSHTAPTNLTLFFFLSCRQHPH